MPDVLESLISEKRLLQAAALLVRSLKLINKQDMLDVGALTDLRSYLSSQETVRVLLLVPRWLLNNIALNTGTSRDPHRRAPQPSVSPLVLVRVALERVYPRPTES